MRGDSPSGVGTDGNAKLGGHQQDRQDLVDTGETTGVDLTDIDGVELKQLLEDHLTVSETASDTAFGSDLLGYGRVHR